MYDPTPGPLKDINLVNCQKALKGKVPDRLCPHYQYKKLGGTQRGANWLVSEVK
jgi:hypothetical protein